MGGVTQHSLKFYRNQETTEKKETVIKDETRQDYPDSRKVLWAVMAALAGLAPLLALSLKN